MAWTTSNHSNAFRTAAHGLANDETAAVFLASLAPLRKAKLRATTFSVAPATAVAKPRCPENFKYIWLAFLCRQPCSVTFALRISEAQLLRAVLFYIRLWLFRRWLRSHGRDFPRRVVLPVQGTGEPTG